MTLRSWTLVGLLAASACTGTPPAPPAEKPAVEEPVPTPELGDMKPGDLAADADKSMVPSPIETQSALEAAGIQTRLADLIQKREMTFDDQDVDDVAVRTGVVIADMLLTVKTAEKEQLLAQLGNIRQGMVVLKGGDDILKTTDDIIDRIKGDAVTRDELLKEAEDLSQALIPELEFEGVKRIVPMIQAGSWLEGANLVARASKDAGNATAADSVLKQPHVVQYFIDYVGGEGADKAPAAVTEKLKASLVTLKGLAEKPESLSEADLDSVIQVTEDVLALL